MPYSNRRAKKRKIGRTKFFSKCFTSTSRQNNHDKKDQYFVIIAYNIYLSKTSLVWDELFFFQLSASLNVTASCSKAFSQVAFLTNNTIWPNNWISYFTPKIHYYLPLFYNCIRQNYWIEYFYIFSYFTAMLYTRPFDLTGRINQTISTYQCAFILLHVFLIYRLSEFCLW